MSFSDRIPNLAQPSAALYTGGEVDAAALEQARSAGVKIIVNLRPDGETPDFNEAAASQELGLDYQHLPITGSDDFNRATVERFDQILAGAGASPTLVHCASGNRVGALFALRAAWLQGCDTEAALTIGRDHGLTKMEPAVRAALDGGQKEPL